MSLLTKRAHLRLYLKIEGRKQLSHYTDIHNNSSYIRNNFIKKSIRTPKTE